MHWETCRCGPINFRVQFATVKLFRGVDIKSTAANEQEHTTLMHGSSAAESENPILWGWH